MSKAMYRCVFCGNQWTDEYAEDFSESRRNNMPQCKRCSIGRVKPGDRVKYPGPFRGFSIELAAKHLRPGQTYKVKAVRQEQHARYIELAEPSFTFHCMTFVPLDYQIPLPSDAPAIAVPDYRAAADVHDMHLKALVDKAMEQVIDHIRRTGEMPEFITERSTEC